MNDTSRETAAATAANEITPEHHNGSTNGHAADTLSDQYHQAQKCVKFIGKDIGIKCHAVSDVVSNEMWRKTVDAEMDFELAGRLAEHMHVEVEEAQQAIVRLSIITHILQSEHVQ